MDRARRAGRPPSPGDPRGLPRWPGCPGRGTEPREAGRLLGPHSPFCSCPGFSHHGRPIPDASLRPSQASCLGPGQSEAPAHPQPRPRGGRRHSQLSRCSVHSCSSRGYLARSMSQATVEVILCGRFPGMRPGPGSWQLPWPDRLRGPPAPPGGASPGAPASAWCLQAVVAKSRLLGGNRELTTLQILVVPVLQE